MNGAFQWLDIVLLAFVAAFIFLRLRSALGRRTGNESSPDEAGAGRFNPDRDADTYDRVAEEPGLELSSAHRDYTSKLDRASREALDQILSIEPGMDLGQFAEGATGAHKMILEAFWAGRLDDVAAFISPGVRAQFDQAIQAREEQGFVLDNELHKSGKLVIASIELDDRTARITIDFHSQIVTVVKDVEGNIIEGEEAEAEPVIDIWTFTRELGSRDPNWVLSSTRAG